MHADRTSRVVLTVLAVLMVAAGALGVIAQTSLFGSDFSSHTLLDNPAARWIGDNSDWFWPVLATVATVVALFALWWLFEVLRPPPKARNIVIGRDSKARRRTSLGWTALRDALTTELQSYRGVNSAKVRVHGEPSDPHLRVRVQATDDADIAELRHRIESEALAHARYSVDAPRMPITLDLTVANESADRVE